VKIKLKFVIMEKKTDEINAEFKAKVVLEALKSVHSRRAWQKV